MSIHKELDKFYTHVLVARQCIDVLNEYTFSTYIEPSAGCGNFIFDKTTKAFDIHPEHHSIIQQDWFDVDLSCYNDVCVYGNPPYGKRNTLTKKFIQHAIGFESVKCIAFVLPQVFNKHTNQKVFPSNWALVKCIELPPNSFVFCGEQYHVPCVFQIWIKDYHGSNLRAVERIDFKNRHFEIVKTGGDLFVMGAAPKTVKCPNDVSATNRGYWIKSFIDIEQLRHNFINCSWSGNSSCNGGVAWLTKTEFINQYERMYPNAT